MKLCYLSTTREMWWTKILLKSFTS